MKYAGILRIFLIMAFVYFVAGVVLAEQPNAGNPKTDQKGCLCFYNSGNGKFYWNAFVKTADKEAPGENGEAEIWGFNVEPGNMEKIHPVKNGMVYPVNALRDIWIPADGRMHEVQAGTMRRKVRCPPYWGGASTQTAER